MPDPVFDHNKKTLPKPPEAKPLEAAKELQNPLAELHQQVGNRAVQRLIQRSGGGQSEVDDDTAGRINALRGGGQSLDPEAQSSMGSAMGYDFSEVRVHTSPEAGQLSKDLGAQAFTTGRDIFFSDGAYEPQSSEGQELLAHELTHVVQQGEGMAGGGSGAMTVNEPGDPHEQQADSVAASVASAPVQLQENENGTARSLPAIQRQEMDEDEEIMSSVPEDEAAAESPGTDEEELSYVVPEAGEPMSTVPEYEGGGEGEMATDEEELMNVEPEDSGPVSSVEEEEESY